MFFDAGYFQKLRERLANLPKSPENGPLSRRALRKAPTPKPMRERHRQRPKWSRNRASSGALAEEKSTEQKSEKVHRAVDGRKETRRSELKASEPEDPAKNEAKEGGEQGDLQAGP